MKKANFKCPECGAVDEIEIPEKSCLHFHKCMKCKKTISPAKGSCCVICSYSDKKCDA